MSTPEAPSCIALNATCSASFSGIFLPPAITKGTGQLSTTFLKSLQWYVLTKCAPCSAAMRQHKARYFESRTISLPTAVTARTGIPYFSPSSTNLERLIIVRCWYSLPTYIESATAETLRRIASSIETVMSSSESSLPMILFPPDTLSTIGTSSLEDIEVRSIPLVSIKESAKEISGSMVFLGTSRPDVGPKKYP